MEEREGSEDGVWLICWVRVGFDGLGRLGGFLGFLGGGRGVGR